MDEVVTSEGVRVESERIDQLPLLYGMLKEMQVAETIDAVLPRPHGNHKGLSYGELAVSFLLFILQRKDHRISYLEGWGAEHLNILNQFFPGATIKDKTSDRVEDLLKLLGEGEAGRWREVDSHPGQHLIAAYQLPTAVGRIDTTSFSVYHAAEEEDKGASIFEYGHSKDRRPDLRQFVEVLGTIDPRGMPLVAETLPGNTADATVYLSAWQRMAEVIGHKDFLLVGDCKLTSLENQARIDRGGGLYLGPLAWTGKLPTELRGWLEEYEPKECTLSSQKEKEKPLQYFELPREQSWQDPKTLEIHTFETRYLVVRSPEFAATQERSFHRRLEKVEAKLERLKSQVGKRGLTTQEAIFRRVGEITSGMEDFFEIGLTEEIVQESRYVGRGRPGPNRKQEVVEKKLFQLSFGRNEEAIAAEEELLGYRVYVTNASGERLAVPQALEIYRDEWTVENNYRRLKGPLLSVIPLYLRDESCVAGMMALLVIALKILTLMEFVVRRNLKAEGATLEGLYRSNPRKKTEKPTAERLLELFQEITLYCVSLGDQRHYQISPLKPLQKQVLLLLGLSLDLYEISGSASHKFNNSG